MDDQRALSVKFKATYWDYLVCGFILSPKPSQIAYSLLLLATFIAAAQLFIIGNHIDWCYFASALVLVSSLPLGVWGRQRKAGKEATITINEQLLANRDNLARVEGRRRWTTVSAVIRRAGLLLIYTSNTTAVFVPERAFKSQEEADKFYTEAFNCWKAGMANRHEIGICGNTPYSLKDDTMFWNYLVVSSLLVNNLTGQPLFVFVAFGCVLASLISIKAQQPVSQARASLNTKPELALKHLKNVLAKGVKKAEPYIIGSSAYLLTERPNEALELCNTGLSFAPDRAEFYGNRAAALLQNLLIDEAVEDANKAISLNPGFWPPYISLATAHLITSQFARTVSDCDEALSINVGIIAAYCLRGLANASMNKCDIALRDCEFAVSICSPKIAKFYRVNALATRAQVCMLTRKIDTALADCDEALRLAPNCISAVTVKAATLCVSKRPDEAMEVLQLAERQTLAPSSKMEIERSKALAELMRHHPDLAFEYAEASNKLFPTPAAQTFMALALAQKGRYPEGLTYVSAAIEQNAYYAEAFWARSEILSKLGREPEAQRDRKLADEFGYQPYIPSLG